MKTALEMASTGMIEPGNIDLTKRPVVKNPDGSISTVRSMGFQETEGGPQILIPTVIKDRVVSPEEAIKHYQKTGEHLGKFETPEEATAYAEKLHEEQAKMYVKDAALAKAVQQEQAP